MYSIDKLRLEEEDVEALRTVYGNNDEEIVFRGRYFAHYKTTIPSSERTVEELMYGLAKPSHALLHALSQLAKALKRAGLVRDDLSRKSFRLGRLLRASGKNRFSDYRGKKCPDMIEFIEGKKNRDYGATNRNYDSFQIPSDEEFEAERSDFMKSFSLSEEDYRILAEMYGINTGKNLTVKKAANKLGLPVNKVKEVYYSYTKENMDRCMKADKIRFGHLKESVS